ncbi:hypothetical protein BGZ47_001916 [Haplosporangium gracile]|nr:hypothetical protein BGZ47_001916 [Haplosporangium gracile]
MAGYPPGHLQSKRNSELGSLWAFAVTSQNAVSAVEVALQHQPDAGATLAGVKKVGFKNINPSDTSGALSDSNPPSPEPSFDNAAQLVDFLISFKWPTSVTSASSTVQDSNYSARYKTVTMSDDAEESADQPSFVDPTSSSPQLWFLTGETRMKTLAEKLSAHQRAFREVVVYETGPRPGFEEELSRWFADTLDFHTEKDIAGHGISVITGDEAQTATTSKEDTLTDLWLVGFSPKGVDLTVLVLKKLLESRLSSGSSSSVPVQIQWGSIGPTTATRIQEHLTTANVSKSGSRATLLSTIAVAKAPKPAALAEAIAAYPSA